MKATSASRGAINAGASGYLPKDTTPEQLCQAVVDLAKGQTVSTLLAMPRRAAPSANSRLLLQLTPRELEVLRTLASSASYQTIAKDLGISPKTLRNHISNTYHKLQIYDRAQAVIFAVQEGVVDVQGLGSRGGEAGRPDRDAGRRTGLPAAKGAKDRVPGLIS